MSILKLYYSDVTKEVYTDEQDAKIAESITKHTKLVSEFDQLRKQYNQEHTELRARYKDKFDSILQAIKALEQE